VKTKAVLKDIKAHDGAIHAAQWTCDGLSMISGSDDTSVKRWDLATGDCVWNSHRYIRQQQLLAYYHLLICSCSDSDTNHRHKDYVRAIATSSTSPDIFYSGSYDHSVKIWDSRAGIAAVSTLQLGAPVEVLKVSAAGSTLFTAAGSRLFVWDVLGIVHFNNDNSTDYVTGAGRLLHTFDNHQKYITDIALTSDGSRALSCGLDGLVKVYNLTTLEVNLELFTL
jgi:U3 small nucleolar RNA-associated protein 15